LRNIQYIPFFQKLYHHNKNKSSNNTNNNNDLIKINLNIFNIKSDEIFIPK